MLGERLQHVVVGLKRAQAGQRLGTVAAGEEAAGLGGVPLVALEPAQERLERGGGHRLDEREQPEVLARVEPHRRGGEEQERRCWPGRSGRPT